MIEKLEADVDLVGRHLRVLDEVRDAEPTGIHSIADATGLARHKVRYSLHVLEKRGVIEPTNEGARTTDATGAFMGRVNDGLGEVIDALDAMEVGR